jgi:hypothetical protein
MSSSHAAHAPVIGSADSYTPPAEVSRINRLAAPAFLVGAIGLGVGFATAPEVALRAYLTGWVMWAGIALGSLALLMLQHMTGGAWGLVARRHLEAASRTLPLVALLFIPVILTLPQIYAWANPDIVEHDALLQAKSPYLNPTAFIVRQVIYFAIWIGLAFLLNRLSARQDQTNDPAMIGRFKRVAAPGLILYCVSLMFAATDWLMSLEPHWFSTIYGVYLLGTQGLSALAFLIAVSVFLARYEPMAHVIQKRHLHDWGKLMFAFIMLWAYFSWSQFLIIWSGNLPEEIGWYLHRLSHGWQIVALFVVLFHFAVPFALLLSRNLKRHGRRLALVAFWMLFVRLVDLVWQVGPALTPTEWRAAHEPGGAHVGAGSPAQFWLYLAAALAVGGLWLFVYVRELRKRPLLPVNDPYLPEALAHAHH